MASNLSLGTTVRKLPAVAALPEHMGMYEADFLQVTQSEKSGDAIAIRFTRPDNGEMAVIVIDAGYTDLGDILADHIKEHYGATHADLVISTHPDADHFNGLPRLLERMTVGELMIHRPDQHGHDEDEVCADKVAELVTSAEKLGMVVTEPFTGITRFGGALAILGPTEQYYEQLLGEEVEQANKGWFAEGVAALTKALKKPVRMAEDHIPFPLPFTDDGGTSARNNSSVIVQLLLEGGTRRLLFTGDAGVPALTQAAIAMEVRGDTAPLQMIQIAHHGSRHNADNEILDRLLGKADREAEAETAALISASKDAPKHPSAKIVNEYKLRRCRVVSTEDGHKRYGFQAPARVGWEPAEELPFMQDGE